MALAEIDEERSACPPTDDLASMWIQRDAEFRHELEDGSTFDERVSRIADVARDLQPAALVGVSETGRRLTQAAAGQLGVPIWEGDGGVDSLLLIDGLVNTGIQLAVGIHEAERAGVERVTALGVKVDANAMRRWGRAGLAIVALEVI